MNILYKLIIISVTMGVAGTNINTFGSTITAASNSSAAVQTAINAAANGDTVVIPSGSVTWSSTVTIPNTKGITLQGNGTTIAGKISVSQSSTTTRITGINFTGTFNLSFDGSKSSAPFRLDHCTFTTSANGSVFLELMGNAPGLIDHNSFTAPNNSEMIHNLGMGPSSDSGWTDDIVPGSANAVYLEDNTFTNNGVSGSPAYFYGNAAIQSYYGARTVFRHNSLSMSHVDQHGTPGMIGARWWEIYENTFYIVPNGDQDKTVALRAGSGVVFNNHKTGRTDYKGDIVLYEEDSGYPALYQVGRGKNQALDPAYVWGNDSTIGVSSGSSNVQVNRDYYLSAKPGYTPYTYPHPLQSGGGSVTVNQSPVAKASATPTSGVSPLAVAFSSSGSSDPEGKPLTYSWSFGDGSAVSTAANPSHTYQTAGTYTARLTVSDGVNSATSSSISINVATSSSSINQPPIVAASATPTSGASPLAVTFSSSGCSDPEGKPLTYSWSFGDGTTTSTSANPTHTYQTAGVYTAHLTVSDGVNSTSCNGTTITVGSVSSSLVAAYGFDEGSGTSVADVSGKGNNGTISGATWTSSGRYGSALSFNGTSSRIAINDSSTLDLTSGMTVEAWVYPTTLSGWRTVLLKQTGNGLAYGLYAYDNAPRPAAYANVGAGDVEAMGTTQLPLNTWTHLAATYNGSVMSIYVNGTLAGSQALTGALLTSTSPLSIGGNTVWGEYFSGQIDEVRVYSRALGATEIQSDMNSPINPQTKPAAPQNLRLVSN